MERCFTPYHSYPMRSSFSWLCRIGSVNLDRFSGFVRQPTGRLGKKERLQIRAIRNYHRVLLRALPVRIFPRQVDAFLLGGLQKLVGKNYASVKSIRAAYQLNGDRLIVTDVLVDNHALSGRIELPKIKRACLRGFRP